MKKVSRIHLSLTVLVSSLLFWIPNVVFGATDPPQCCSIVDPQSQAVECTLKITDTCQPIETWSCPAGIPKGDGFIGCDTRLLTPKQIACHTEKACQTQVFSDTGVFWEYTERQKVKYGLPAELIIKITPSAGFVINDMSCVNCESTYSTVLVQSIENGSSQMVITFDVKKFHDEKYIPGKSLSKAFSIMAEVVSNGKTTYTLREPVVEWSGVTEQESLCQSFTPAECIQAKETCFSFNSVCHSKTAQNICASLPQNFCGTDVGSSICTWSSEKNICQDALTTQFANEYGVPENYEGPLPPCAFDGSCRDVNQILAVAIKIGELALGFVGSLALVFFVYGGFTMILSMGNAEKVKKGREILVAAVIGIVIAFSAYAIVNFTLDVLQVQGDEFRVIK